MAQELNTHSRSVKVGSLLLDSKNARIPSDRRSDDQRALLHALVQYEDIRGLAASIAKLGLFPNERLLVMLVGRRFVVLEGNRRLAAIRLLLTPELAETSTQVKSFRSLSAKANLAELSSIDVAIVNNRMVAAPIIAALHTKDAKKRWSSLQQARFYRELLEEGESPSQVAEQVGQSLGHVNGYLRTERLYSIALELDYPLEIRSKIADSKFPLTTLERFLGSKIGRKFLGVELDEEHGFLGKVHADRFKAVLQRVVTDVVNERAMTRKVNDETDFKKYVAEADKKIPKTKKRGSFFPRDLLSGSAQQSDDDRSKKPLPKRPPRQSKSVIPIGFTCTSKHDRVRAIFSELKKMNIQQQRNSTGVMLRVLIDIALWSYLKDEKHDVAVCNHFNKTKNNPNRTPPLRDLISYSVEKRLFHGMTADGGCRTNSFFIAEKLYFGLEIV